MCTLTFLPLEKHNFLLTSSRDEQKTRKNSELPSLTEKNGVQILRPVDGDAGGSWIGFSDKGRTLCLLNGAFLRHNRQPPYRKSRGIILMELLALDNENQMQAYDFDNIESFTLVWIEKLKTENSISLTEYRYVEEEKKLYRKELNSKNTHIWSSATLYTPEVAEKREDWFEEWLENYRKSNQSLIELSKLMWYFHVKGGEKQNATPREQILMQDEYGGTVSLTQIISYFHQKSVVSKLTMKHYDLNTLKSSFDELQIH